MGLKPVSELKNKHKDKDIYVIGSGPTLNFKPFNCSSCLAAWVALLLLFLPDIFTQVTFYMFTAGVVAPLARNTMIKLYKLLI